jgi:hypothetical protein
MSAAGGVISSVRQDRQLSHGLRSSDSDLKGILENLISFDFIERNRVLVRLM